MAGKEGALKMPRCASLLRSVGPSVLLCRVVRARGNAPNALNLSVARGPSFIGRYALPSGAASASGLIVMSNSCNI